MMHPGALLIAGLVICCLIHDFVGYLVRFRVRIR
jgi:hypothetical protein